MARSIVFDTGPIISLVTNNLLWVLEPLKRRFGGKFYITPAVKRELIDKAISTKRFEFEALQIFSLLKKGILEIAENSQIQILSKKLLDLANHSFKARGSWIRIVSDAEIETLAADAVLNSDASVIDERTIRLLLENSPSLTNLMEIRLHCKVQPNKDNIKEFKKQLNNVRIIRSTELIVVAYKLGLLDEYSAEKSDMIKNPDKMLLDAALWALKIRGCSISSEEIQQIVELEAK